MATQTTANGMQYIGNPDFRGYINAVAPGYLGFVGNDGGVNQSALNSYLQSTGSANATPDQVKFSANQINQHIADLVSQYNKYQSAPKAASTASNSALSTLSGTSGGTSGVTVGVNDPATLAAYQQTINNYKSQIGLLPTQLQGADKSINASYTNAYNQLLGQKNQATAGYNTSTTANKQSYVTNKNQIGQNAGTALSGLLRLLGSRGAGGSSAALFGAPLAIGQQATGQRANAGLNFGQNQSGLDTSYNTYLTQNANDLSSAQNQRDQQLSGAQSQIDSTRAGLLLQLATLKAQQAAATGSSPTTAAQSYLDQANGYLKSAANLGLNVSPIKYNTSAYTAPTPASYAVNPFATASSSNPNQGIISNTVSPAYNALLKPKLSGATSTGA